MEANIVKGLLAMSEATKAHALALTDEDLAVFVAKSAEDQAAEVKKATEVLEAAKAAKKKADDAKNGMDPAEPDADDKNISKAIAKAMAPTLELLKSMQATNAEITKRLNDREAEQEIAKRASSEFHGFPGGDTKAIEILKSIKDLPEAARTQIESTMKSQIAFAKTGGLMLGLTAEDFAKTAPASAELHVLAVAKSQKDGITVQEATGAILNDPLHSDLFDRVNAEEHTAN